MKNNLVKTCINMTIRSLIICIWVCTNFTFASKVKAQNLDKVQLSMHLTNVPLQEVITTIKNQTEFTFFYEDNLLRKVHNNVTLSVEHASLREILEKITTQLNLSYKQVNNTIALKLAPVKSAAKNYRSKTAQQSSVSGVVKDASGPLPGVNILIKGTAEGTQTDFNGNYTIKNVPENATLVYSYIGYTTTEEKVNGRTTIDVTLSEDTQNLEEVVVIGYGSVKKSDVTGAVSSIKAEDLNPGANVSVQQALEGRTAGVQIYQKSGEPGAAMAINIRGASSITAGNDPLYVIDGVPVNNQTVASSGGAGFVGNQNSRNPLNSLNPEDIASIEILKDASATAIYGSRGSNGVVLITTKSGRTGALKVVFDSYLGVQTVANSLDLLTPVQYKNILNSIIDDGGGSESQRVTDIEGTGTNWQELLYRDAIIQNHNLALSGGTDKVKYYASLNYFDQDGVVKNSGVKRYNARVNLTVSEQKKYNFGINLNSSYIFDDFVAVGTGLNENAGAIYSAINYDPTILPYDANGNYQQSSFVGPQIDNPLALLNGEDATSKTFRTYGNIYGEYFITPTFSAKVRLGADVNSGRRDVFVSPETIQGSGYGGIASIITQQRDYYLAEATFNYNEDFGNDHINAVVGATYEHFGTTDFSGDGRGFSLPDLETDGIGSGDPTLNHIGSGRQSAKFASFLGRVNYSLNNKYLFTASLRADGSSRFGPSHRFGYFPSGAFAWKINEEDFLKNNSTVSELKLRASYGAIGNANIANYLYMTTYDTAGTTVFANNKYTVISPGTTAPNPDLKWESAQQLDVGVDFGLWKGRLTGTVDYYNRKTSDLLLTQPLPPDTGYTGITTNVGSMKNYGFELSLNGTIISNNDFSWDANFNITTINNKVLDLGNVDQIITGGLGFTGSASIIKPGEPMNSYYGYIVDGVWQQDDDFSVTDDNVAPGDLKYRDLDGNGTINDKDRTIIGKPFPDYTWGFTNNLKYKRFNLSIYVQGVQGVSTLNNNLVDSYFPVNFRRNRFAEPYLNRWTPDNPTNKYPSFVNPTAQGQRVVNTRTVEDASYLRLQSVRLGYDVPVKNMGFLKRLNLYVTGQNLLTITNYSGVDPSANAAGSNVLRIDYNAYPFARTYLFGLNVEF
ncbi:TonB-dependent receptor [Zhouia sp. PK063]|uniref:TonB-dependent receptor n=1 Tax=Zhouia sp. PK063 TaxID=3373602 RepID=UPI0037B9B757